MAEGADGPREWDTDGARERDTDGARERAGEGATIVEVGDSTVVVGEGRAPGKDRSLELR